jgi:uncharacterized membrane protein YfcA
MDGVSYGLLFLAGTSAGFVDAIAGGGGLITVPALLWAGLPAPLALGTNKFQAACGTALAVWNYQRAGLVSWDKVRLAALITFVAAAVGTLAVTHTDASILRQVIPWLLLAVTVYVLVSPGFGREPGLARWPPLVFAWVFGGVIGFYDGFFGPGTGSFWTLAFVTLQGLELRSATARTKVVNLASNLASVTIFLLMSQVRFEVGLVMIAGQLIGANAGSRLVITRGIGFIRLVFLAVVTALTLRLFWPAGG